MTISQRTRAIEEIKRGVRHRKDYGDLDALARSIDEKGLLQPIAITPHGMLIAGERRMLAWPKTKFHDQPIPVHVVNLDEIVRGEWAENADRKDFTPSESVAIRRALEPMLKAEARERQGARSDLRGTSPNVNVGRAADKIAAFVGKDRRTLDRAEAVVAAAEAEPEKYGKLVEAMDRTGRVNGPFKRLQVLKQSEALRASPPPMPIAALIVAWSSIFHGRTSPTMKLPLSAVGPRVPIRPCRSARGARCRWRQSSRMSRGVDVGDELPHALCLRIARCVGLDSDADDPDLGQGQDGPRPGSPRQD